MANREQAKRLLDRWNNALHLPDRAHKEFEDLVAEYKNFDNTLVEYQRSQFEIRMNDMEALDLQKLGEILQDLENVQFPIDEDSFDHIAYSAPTDATGCRTLLKRAESPSPL